MVGERGNSYCKYDARQMRDSVQKSDFFNTPTMNRVEISRRLGLNSAMPDEM